MDISTRNACISSVLPHRPSSVLPSISLILYWQTAIQFDQLKNTRVARHWNGMMWNLVVKVWLCMNCLSYALQVCLLLSCLFANQISLINGSECLGSASISIRSGAFPNGGTTHCITRLRNRTSLSSRSCGRGPGRGPGVAMCFTSKCLLKASLNSAI